MTATEFVVSGLCVRLSDLPGAHTAGACLRVAAGSSADPVHLWGTAHLTEHIRIAAVTGSGLHITGRTENTETRFTMAGLAEQSESMVGALTRILDPRNTIGSTAFEAERAAVNVESRAAAVNPLLLLGPAAAEAALPGEGLADALRATVDTVGRITPAHVDAFTGERYRPGAAVLTFAGPLPDPGALLEVIAEALPACAATPPPPARTDAGVPALRLPAELDGLLVLTVPVAEPAPFSRSVARALAAAAQTELAVIGRTTVTSARREVIVLCWRGDRRAEDLRTAVSGTLAAARRGDEAMADAWRSGVLRSFQEHAFARASPLGRAQSELLDPPLNPATAPDGHASALPGEMRRTADRARLWRVAAGKLHPETVPQLEEKP
ncbi:hypothetical protein [Actinoplanes sp. NBRC 103695]|uniref:hypothetical protein n=1 Tax=Actinoplanes sp. NBRC 103695 TaxID=3032202 RepID=UPI0024A51F4B|nr:hypothetical protein [Actinoplanes sp. NBRC 103695]GLZ01150.1 hypothetical protein Acsp02_84010 [Actinoplanes sp. NBRC 103695]